MSKVLLIEDDAEIRVIIAEVLRENGYRTLAAAHGADAICLFGEVSPFHTGAELNYLALENFGSPANPSADLDLFVRQMAAPLLGGPTHAREYLELAKLARDPARVRAALPRIYQRCGILDPGAARRWAWLGNFLASCTQWTL